MLNNSGKTHVVDQNFETAKTKTDPKKASGRQVSRLAKTTKLLLSLFPACSGEHQLF